MSLALGVKPFFLANCLLGVIAQRLLRTLCTNCRVRYDVSMAPSTFADIKALLEPVKVGGGERDTKR